MMHSVVYDSYGGFDHLRIVEESIPSNVETNDLLIGVKAASINPIDWKIMQGELFIFRMLAGSKFPKHIGSDFAGEVIAVGAKVHDFKVGDKVYGSVDPLSSGSLSEKIIINADKVMHMPNHITYQQAAVIPIACGAALNSMKVGKIKQGSEILINGCTGGVGIYLIQIAKAAGAIITGTCSSRGVEIAKSLGCDHVVDYTKEDVKTLPKQYDVIIDLAMKWSYHDVAHMMKPHASMLDLTPSIPTLMTAGIRNIFTRHKILVSLAVNNKEIQADINRVVTNGLRIEVARSFRLPEAREAYEYAKKGGFIGKVVVEVS